MKRAARPPLNLWLRSAVGAGFQNIHAPNPKATAAMIDAKTSRTVPSPSNMFPVISQMLLTLRHEDDFGGTQLYQNSRTT